jgi:hypothetical protein
MARTLKRPMFRRGGTVNDGIMTGLVDRVKKEEGSKAQEYADEYYEMLSQIKPSKPKLPLGQIGLNLISGQFAGDGLLRNLAGSAQDPYAQFVKADDAMRNIDYQTKMAATKMGISRAEAERLAMMKNQKKTDYAAQTPEEQFKVRSKIYSENKIPQIRDNAANLASFEIRHRDKPYVQLGFAYSNKTRQFEPQFNNVPDGAITYNPADGRAFKREGDKFIELNPFTLEPIENVDGTE